MSYGVNLGAGTFDVWPGTTSVIGGTHGDQFTYPTNDEIDLINSLGIKVVRFGVVGSRIAPTKFGPYSSSVQLALAGLRRLIGYGIKVYLEFHEYGRSYGQIITTAQLDEMLYAAEAFAEFKNNPLFVLCFQNEPEAMQASLLTVAQEWINRARAKGWNQTLCIPCPYWSGLPQIWDNQDSRAQLITIKDPLNKLIVDVHYYYDTNLPVNAFWSGPGQSDRVFDITDADVDSGAYVAKFNGPLNQAWKPALDWARANGIKLLLGETQLANTKVGNACRPLLLAFLNSYSDVFVDVTYWLACKTQSTTDAFTMVVKDASGNAVLSPLGQQLFKPVVVTAPPAPAPTTTTPAPDINKSVMYGLCDTVLSLCNSSMSRTQLSAAIQKLRDSFK